MTQPTQPESAAQPHTEKQSTTELEVEIARTRAEVASTLEELSNRLDPRVRIAEATDEAKQAASDVVTLVKGGGLPEEDPRRSRNVRIAVGTVALTVATVTWVVVSAVRKRRAR